MTHSDRAAVFIPEGILGNNFPIQVYEISHP
jgi:hypothetical protein